MHIYSAYKTKKNQTMNKDLEEGRKAFNTNYLIVGSEHPAAGTNSNINSLLGLTFFSCFLFSAAAAGGVAAFSEVLAAVSVLEDELGAAVEADEGTLLQSTCTTEVNNNK